MEWHLFANLAETAGSRHIPVAVDSGATVDDAIDILLEEYPALADEVRTEDGELQDHLTVLRNGEAITDGLDIEVSDTDELALMPPVSGG